MLTCRSPRKVMRVAYELARRCLPAYRHKFSRKDFTLPQLFACLVLREHQGHGYRGVEALLRDAEHWCRDIGMKKVPDHNTLCRVFHALHLGRRVGTLMDRLTQWFALAKQLGTTAAIDSTLFDTHHRSRHYEQRCRHYASKDPGHARSTRSRSAKRAPKLTIACDTKTHVILSARPRIGMGSDAPEVEPALREALRRLPPRKRRTVLADAGYDSESNHRIARLDMGVRSLIKADAGRPSAKPPTGHYRRLMRRRLEGSQKGKPYGQRAQVETVASMLKRNLGDALRAKSPRARRHEMILRSLTHDIMIRRFQRIETEPLRPRFSPPEQRGGDSGHPWPPC